MSEIQRLLRVIENNGKERVKEYVYSELIRDCKAKRFTDICIEFYGTAALKTPDDFIRDFLNNIPENKDNIEFFMLIDII